MRNFICYFKRKKLIVNNYIELKLNDFFCEKMYKLIFKKKRFFLELNVNICRWLFVESNINENVFLVFFFLSLNIFIKYI